MRYFGSKISSVDKVYTLVNNIEPSGSFCDPFGGIGSVSSKFLSEGYDVWSGDILLFPHYFQIARLKSHCPNFFEKLLQFLGLQDKREIESYINDCPPANGWFVREYSEKRLFFTRNNALKIQGVRRLIYRWNRDGLLNYDEFATLLASLIDCMDKVANTAGTYYASLKKFNRKSNKQFLFQLINSVVANKTGNCYFGQAIDLVAGKSFDILYLDPPYNERSYPHYYHLPQTIAMEGTPKVYGKAGIPRGIINKSGYTSLDSAKNQLVSLLNVANFKLLVFHYADNGLIPKYELKEILSKYGQLNDYYIDSKGYTTKHIVRNVTHHLYCIYHA